ncbi:hypothetical protein VZT92_005526 [Zoarces viviparus]|uniref:Uncharacterized protein n=1 Tax=Zoarces viviparus TaxID=48416 RepID=A0AAW1FV46_ZOAVI
MKEGGVREYSLSSARSTAHNWRRTRAPRGKEKKLDVLILEREVFILIKRTRRKSSRDKRELREATASKQEDPKSRLTV